MVGNVQLRSVDMDGFDKSIVIVEDEMLVAMMMEDIATDLGWTVAGSAGTEDAALALLKAQTPNVALLDINLGKGDSLGVADWCRVNGVKVIFTSGYVARDLPDACGDAPVIAKPFTAADLGRALARVEARA